MNDWTRFNYVFELINQKGIGAYKSIGSEHTPTQMQS